MTTDCRFAVMIQHVLLAVALLGGAVTPMTAQVPEVTVGIAMDGLWERNDAIRTGFEQEIESLLRGEFDVRFPVEKRRVADFTAEGVTAALDDLLSDPGVDVLLTVGPHVSINAALRTNLPKPVIAPYIIDPTVQAAPYRDGASGQRNLSYVSLGVDSLEDVRRFLEIVTFRRLGVLVSEGLDRELPEGILFRESQEAGLDIEIVDLPVKGSADDVLAAIPADIEAVYLTPLLELSAGEFDRLVEGLIERKLPSFSLWGREEVAKGILAGLGLEIDRTRLARRVALNLQRILLGEPAENLPVAFEHRQRLTINMRTARAIGVYPSFALMTEAELLQSSREVVRRRVSLAAVVREAVDANLDLLSAQRTVDAGRQQVRRARANLGPQVSAGASGALIDSTRAEQSFGSTGRFNLTGSLGASQLIYSESVRANYDIERILQRTREEERIQLRLDIIREAATAYLEVLRAKTSDGIQKSNLELTRQNLELARNRRELGVASPDEVYRFESEIAQNRQAVINASAFRNQAEIALNRLVDHPLEEPFETADASLDDPELLLSFERLRPYVSSLDIFRLFRDFMAEEAFAASPELRRLDAAIAGQQRALTAARRVYYVPEVAAQAEVAGVGRYGTTAATLPPGLGFDNLFGTPSALQWTVGFSATLPLFTSGAHRAEVARIRDELAGLEIARDSVRQIVEQRVRSALHAAGASFASIELARARAEAAKKTLDVVTDSYSRGIVDNIRLLDAQNQALLADLSAANSVYNFLIDLMEVERAAGRFDFFVAPGEQQEFFRRLETFYEQQGMEVRK